MRRSRITCIKVSLLAALLALLVVHSALPGARQAEGGKEDDEVQSQDGIVALLKELDSHTVKRDAEEGQGADSSLAGERVHGLPNVTKEEAKGDGGLRTDGPLEDILTSIYEANYNQAVRNEDLFGPISNETVVIVVQVHNRLIYLRQLVESLSVARGIDKTLLVFSHDVWDSEINSLVRSIEFAPVAQMFYPFSLQTHPRSFPGESPTDCPRDLKPDKAKLTKCTNRHWPDMHGHYREAKFTQTKHHWWWKANQVFHRLEATRSFTGTVLFLEEDHYVAEDFLVVLHLMEKESDRLAENKADILCLGTYLRKFQYKTKHPPVASWPNLGGLLHHGPQARRLLAAPAFLSSLLSVFHKVEVTQWISSKHNMGMAFTRAVWDRIAGCSAKFCQYDDYNWDWSLQHVSLNCLQDKLQVMMVKGPRVFHIGECGVHHKQSDCDANVVIVKVKSILKTAKSYLFPQRLSVVKTALKKKLKLKKGNGGWGDRRDHALCLNMTIGSSDH